MSDRTLTQAAKDALEKDNVPALVLVELSLDSGPVRVCNAGYAFEWPTGSGQIFQGVGALGKISGIEEGADFQAFGISMELSGIPTEYVSMALNEQYQGRKCIIWFAPLTEDYAFIADPAVAFRGRIDVMEIMIGNSATITLNAESRHADLDRPRVSRYNDASQQALYPGDLGLQYIEQMVDKSIVWGKA